MRNLIYNGAPMLLCTGLEPHASEVPRVDRTEGATGDVKCTECGAPMLLVDVLVVDRDPSWARLDGEHRRTRRYYS